MNYRIFKYNPNNSNFIKSPTNVSDITVKGNSQEAAQQWATKYATEPVVLAVATFSSTSISSFRIFRVVPPPKFQWSVQALPINDLIDDLDDEDDYED